MKSKIGKSLLRFLGGALIFLLAAWALVIFWLGPRYVETQLIDDIAAFWNGQAMVEGVNFRIFHPITVKSVILENGTGKPCLEAKGVTLLFKEWPSRDIQLTGIALDRLDVRIQFQEEGGGLSLKKPTSPSSDPQESSDPLGSFSVDNLTVQVSNTKNASVVLDDLSLSAVRNQTGYDLSLKQRSSSDLDKFSLSGDINSEDSKINVSLGLSKDVNKSLTAGVLSLLELPLPFDFEGNISADITLTGALDDISSLEPAGTVTLKDCSILKGQTVWAEKINTSVQVNGPHIQVQKMMADSFGGQVEGSLDAEIKQKKLTQFQGYISGKDIKASKGMEALADTERSGEGVLAFDYTFTADEAKLKQMKGHGTISLEQVDYKMMPVVDQIIRTVSRNGSKIKRKANAIGTFETAGPLVTFQKARLANDWVAIETLPGVTFDLQTGLIETNVIVALIKHINDVLNAIPVVNLFVGLKDHLTCLHVKANIYDTSNIKITKQPLRDVAKGTLDFFQGVAGTGDDFFKVMKGTPKRLPKEKEN